VKVRRRAIAPTLWDLVEAFFLARTAFGEVYENYETRVLAHAAEQGIDRRDLRLDATAVSKLLDFAKLESLRNGPLHDLKEIAHALFRKRASTDKLDRYASEIFHELSILKEEQYKVSTFAPEYHKTNELSEYESILEEVHQEFPRKVHNIHDLFAKARLRIEEILKRSRDDPVLVRSLALFGEKLLEKAYPRGLSDLYRFIYPGGEAEAHLVAARSFARGGFKQHAVGELTKALDAATIIPTSEESRAQRSAFLEEATTLRARLEALTPLEMVQTLAAEAPAAPASLVSSGATTPPTSGRYETLESGIDDLDEGEAPESHDSEARTGQVG
jgi:hypothetical protein